jgi:polyisoprenoid-binding protein YceI
MTKRTLCRLLPVLLVLVLAACAAPAAAPASSGEAAAPAAAAAGATEAAAAVAGDIEAPPVDPAEAASEATAVPAVDQDGGRVFRIVPEASVAQYAVEEEFFGQAVPFVTAVGKTNAFNGEVTLDIRGNTVAITAGQFTVDLSTLTSDRPRRDRAIREEWLESNKYPTATFVATGIGDLPADAALGQDVAFDVTGNLTIRDVTQPVTWAMTARLDGATLSGVGTTTLLMRDFGFEPPDIAGILKVTDGVSVTVTYVANEVK